MGSTETSDVGVGGLASPADSLESSNIAVNVFVAVRRVIEQVSPVTLAVAATAFISAGTFVFFDAVRTSSESSSRLELIAKSFAADLSAVEFESVSKALERGASFYGPGLQASLRAANGHIVASTQTSDTDLPAFHSVAAIDYRSPANQGDGTIPGTLWVGFDHGAVFNGVWQRGIGVLALAFGMTGLAFRRRAQNPASGKPRHDPFQDLIASIPFGVACWSPSGELVVCNEHYNLTLSPDGTNVPPALSYHAAVRELSQGGYMRLVSNDDKTRLLELHREDGSCLLIDERPMAEGGFVTFLTDVTERKRTDVLLNSIREEQRLLARRYHEEKIKAEAASRSKTSFLAHLSHDIRTPLNHIIGFADLMRHQTYGPIGDPRYLDYVEAIKGSGERLLGSFATILDLAELDGGQRALREEPVDIDELIVATTHRFSSQAARAGLALSIGVQSKATVIADKFCLERMLGNIVENAIRFTPSGGKVMLAAFAATDGVVLEISDTGIGMTEEQLASLSQPFVLGDAAFTREHGGTGLGIAIARAIAELSGGRLAIDSSSAMGTTVAISLPLRNTRQQEATQAA
jgi:two-component system cell cycle sensor histidine kinase PleC